MSTPQEQLRARLSETTDPRQQLRERLAAEEDGPSALNSFLRNLAKSTGDAAGQALRVPGDLLAMGAAGLEGTVRGLTPGGEGFEYGRRYQEEKDKFPANISKVMPTVTTNEVIAGGRAALSPLLGGPGVGDAYADELAGLEAEDQAHREENPIASGLGQFGGTVASLLLSKRPLQGSINRAEEKIMKSPLFQSGGGKRELLDDVNAALSKNWARLPARGAFRAGETGLEAAYLEVLSDAENDPMMAAGLASGAQMASSAFYSGLKGLTSGGPGSAAMKLTAAAFATGGMWQMIKSASPGGRDRVLESIESGFDKTAYAVMLGGLGSAMGARGRGKEVSEPLQNLIEGFTTIPRAGVISLITEFASAPEADQKLFEQTIDSVLANPSYEGRTEQQKQLVNRLREALDE